MNRGERIERSETARARRRRRRDILFACTIRKFNKLRKMRRNGKPKKEP